MKATNLKSFMALLAILCLAFSLNAQLKVNDKGRVYVGTEIQESGTTIIGGTPSSFEWPLDTCMMLSVFGKYNTPLGGGSVSFGDNNANMARYVGLGELGRTDTDQLWLFGRKGLYLTSLSNDTVCYYDVNKGDFFQFNCDVKTTGVFVASDSRYKKDVSPLDNAIDGLSRISPVSYRLVMNDESTESVASASVEISSLKTEKEIETEEIRSRFAAERASAPSRFGFLAQEVREVYPELVKTDSIGYMYIDYIGFIPLLVNAINELEARTAEQAETIEVLETLLANENVTPMRMQASTDNVKISEIIPKLYQNRPNPFTAQTEIRFDLPTSVSQADIYIYEMQGHQIKKIEVKERGNAGITIAGEDLQPGMYIYTLIADGAEIDTKRMILTD